MAVVEFHGFTDNYNKFIIKELAIVSNSCRLQLLFKSPYSKNNLNEKVLRTTRWLTRKFHKIKWDQDGIPFDKQLLKCLLKPYPLILTKGLNKVRFLEEFHSNVQELSFSNDHNVMINCIIPEHDRDTPCALASAVSYYNKYNSRP